MECSTRSRQDCAKPRLPREGDLTARAHGFDASIGEFQLIERFFRRSAPEGRYVALGGGDDCALLASAAGQHWAVSTDTLIEGVHFFPNVDPAALGHKSLAVGLSDLAACGATPHCFFLALALPRVDETWLAGFSRGLYALADAHQCVLAGGDTTRSPNAVVITITVMGSVPVGSALLRSGARVGDDVWVSGELGDAALGLAFRSGEIELPPSDAEQVVSRLEWPTPRVRLGERLVGIASSAIDVSDGLAGDLRHVLRASAVGAVIEWARVPRSPVLQRQPMSMQQRCALTRGDDYEILFTAAASRRAEIIGGAAETVSVTRIGAITATADLAVLDEIGAPVETATGAYDHFGR
jgi:thiamine-monophosphate kinase